MKLRLEAHPTRTDSSPADTGRLRLQGTLGKAEAMPDVPVALTADWTLAPLGAVSTLLTGNDAGFRGEMNLHANVLGTLGANALETRLQLTAVHRADFVPAQTLDVDLACQAHAASLFHQLTAIRCAWPPTGIPPTPAQTGFTLSGQLPSLVKPSSAVVEGTVQNLPADRLLTALRLLSQRIPAQLVANGQLSGQFSCCASPAATFRIPAAQLTLSGTRPLLEDADLDGHFSAGSLILSPIPLDLGAPTPATLDLRADRTGLHLHLTGSALRSRLLAFASALPQFGDGLREALPPQPEVAANATPDPELHIDLTATRPWPTQPGLQVWSATPVPRTLPAAGTPASP